MKAISGNPLTGVCTPTRFIHMETVTTLLSGYRGSKVHAVDPDFRPTVSLCGWGVDVSELPFTDNGLACKVCAKAATNR